MRGEWLMAKWLMASCPADSVAMSHSPFAITITIGHPLSCDKISA
jgi:hypothetical protein